MLRRILDRLSGLYIGWRMIGVSCAIRVLGGGLHAYGLSVLFLPVTQELGLTRTATSLVFSLARAQGAIEGPIAGYCIDRFGPRPVITIAVALAGIGYLLFAGVHSYAMLLVVYMGIISLSYQAGFMDATMVVANTWFIRKRALAMSITSGSIALGGALLTPFFAYAVHTWGWRAACIGSGIAFLLAGVPLSLLIQLSPESLGLLPDGAPPNAKPTGDGVNKTTQQSAIATEYSLRDTLRTRQFWLLTLSTTLRATCSSAVLVHFVPILVWQGYSEPQGAFYLGVIAFCGMPTHLLIGWLGDRMYKPRLMAGFMVLGSVSVYFLFQGTQAWQLWFAVLLFSVFEGLFPVTWATVGDFFGRNNFAKIRGSMSFLYSWGSVLGPVIAGSIYDRTKSYAVLFWVLLVTCWVTAALYAMLFQPGPRPKGD
ncbi:MAG TPA: MFS transporter [Candidatus Deferrimicrobium sp.]|nr:MFS transporter [Candidatus Deferrimicrobium sp.]